VRAGVLLFGCGFMLLSRLDSVASFYATFVLIAIGSGLAGFLTINIVVANWFERVRARAMSLSAAGGSVSGLLVPVVAWSLATYGWRTTALCSGVFILLIGLPIAQLVRQSPEPYGYVPDGRRATVAPGTSQTVVSSAGCRGGHTAAVLLLASAESLALVFAFAILHGLAWGIRGPLMMAVRADYFGRRSFATIEGFASIVTTCGLVTGPLLVGLIAD